MKENRHNRVKARSRAHAKWDIRMSAHHHWCSIIHPCLSPHRRHHFHGRFFVVQRREDAKCTSFALSCHHMTTILSSFSFTAPSLRVWGSSSCKIRKREDAYFSLLLDRDSYVKMLFSSLNCIIFEVRVIILFLQLRVFSLQYTQLHCRVDYEANKNWRCNVEFHMARRERI